MISQITKVCVTGGAGFIGSHVVCALLDRGLEVTVLDDLSIGRRENVPDAARLLVADVRDEAALRQAMAGTEVVLHLAARVAIRSSFEFAVEDAAVNVVGTAAVLRAASATRTIRRVITTSSMAVYADAPRAEPIDESHATAPISPYGISKLASEQLTHAMCAHAGIQSGVLRLFNTFGPGQTLSPYVGVVTIFVNALARGESPAIFGDGEQCRDFVHVQDVAAAFLAAMESEISGETFNIGSGRATSVNQVYEGIRSALQSAVAARHEPAVGGELRYSIADVTKATRLLGYRPRFAFDSTVGEVVEEILSQQARR